MPPRFYPILGLLAFVFASCTQVKPSKIKFEGFSFELPSKVSDLQRSLGLVYGCYSGFNKGNVNEPMISVQMEGNPIFMGNDTDSEESFHDKTVVGVTFALYDHSDDSVLNELECSFGRSFTTETIQSRKSKARLSYYFLKTTDNLFIGARELEKIASKERYFKVSFYKGIAEDEFINYFEPHFE